MIANRMYTIGSASSIEQNELVYKLRSEGKDPIILSYGEAPFSISPIHLNDSLWDRGSHYSEGLGVPEFRKELAEYSKKYYGFTVDAKKNILVTAGSKIASFYISQLFLNQKDSILLHEPSWVSYQEHARLSGATTRFLPMNDDLSKSYEYLADPNCKIFYINNPNNPRGYVYKKNELYLLANYCKETSTILVVDESYSDFCISEEFYSAGNLINEFDNVILFNSISKNFGLSGWRLGYIFASEKYIAQMNKLNQHLMTCAPTNLQLALVGNLSDIRNQINPQIHQLNQKRIIVGNLLDKLNIKYLSGSSTFYFFLDFRDKIKDSKKFAINFLKENLVSLIPGTAYGESTEGFLRISFGIETVERIEVALTKLVNELKV